VNDFVQISDKAYVREQVLGMEKAILGKLEWYLTVPTPYMFLTRYVKACIPIDSEVQSSPFPPFRFSIQFWTFLIWCVFGMKMENLVYFFAELGIMNYTTIIKYPPSILAASSVYAAQCTLNKSPSWTETLKHYTGYSEEQLK